MQRKGGEGKMRAEVTNERKGSLKRRGKRGERASEVLTETK